MYTASVLHAALHHKGSCEVPDIRVVKCRCRWSLPRKSCLRSRKMILVQRNKAAERHGALDSQLGHLQELWLGVRGKVQTSLAQLIIDFAVHMLAWSYCTLPYCLFFYAAVTVHKSSTSSQHQW